MKTIQAKRITHNVFKVDTPDISGCFLRAYLNGEQVKDLISLKIEIPSGKNALIIKVSLEFYSAIDAKVKYLQSALHGNRLTLEHPPIAEVSSTMAAREFVQSVAPRLASDEALRDLGYRCKGMDGINVWDCILDNVAGRC